MGPRVLSGAEIDVLKVVFVKISFLIDLIFFTLMCEIHIVQYETIFLKVWSVSIILFIHLIEEVYYYVNRVQSWVAATHHSQKI